MNPPEEGSYHSFGKCPTSPRRTRCIEMDGVTGLTVFCSPTTIYAIHGHRAHETALDTYRTLQSNHQRTAIWCYFPLQNGEVITRAWARKTATFTRDDAVLVVRVLSRYHWRRELTLIRFPPLVADSPSLALPTTSYGAHITSCVTHL